MQSIEIREYQLYLFDLDDTLTKPVLGKTFPQTAGDRALALRRKERLEDLHKQDKKMAVITNQGGAAWGFLDMAEMNAWLDSFCETFAIDAFFVCYRDTGEKAKASDKTIKALTVPEYYKEWDRRKPGPGMLIEAMDHFGIDRHDTIMIGDRQEDKDAAENCGCDFIFAWDYFKDGPIIV